MSAKSLSHDHGTVGMRVQDYWGRLATVRWIGKLDRKTPGPGKVTGQLWGIEYDNESESPLRFNGTLESGGKALFACAPKKGLLCKSGDLFPEINTESVKLLRLRFGERVASWHDFELIKFCIARRFDMPKVYAMLEKHLDWRDEFKPNADEYFSPSIAADYPAGYMGVADYDENLIYCERPSNGGFCHPSDFVKKVTLPVIARWHAAGIEMGIRRMRASNYHNARVCYVVDLQGVKAMTRPMIGFAQTFTTVEQDNYPENLGRCFIVNTPTFFRIAWKLVKIFIDERTNKKINFCAANHAVSSMKEIMKEEYIPDFAGGTATMWRKTNRSCLGGDNPSMAHAWGDAAAAPFAANNDGEDDRDEIVNDANVNELGIASSSSPVSPGSSTSDRNHSPRNNIAAPAGDGVRSNDFGSAVSASEGMAFR